MSGSSGLGNSGYFDGKAIDRLIEQHRSGLSDHSRVLWLLWMFQGFLNDVHAPSTVAPQAWD
jgi:asparagine synthase (glutamine-hydrolysing)